MSGRDLVTLLSGGDGLETGHALAIVGQVAAALGPEHERGFAHGAIEPANVLLEGDRALLTNFGAGSEPRAAAPAYVAPELLAGRAPSPRSDVYSLACLLCAALTGRPPEPGRHGLTLPAGLPAGLEAVIATALATDPAERPASAGELMHAVRAAAAAGGADPPARRPWWRRLGRHGG